MGARQADLGSSLTTLHADHETTQTLAVDVLLPRHLLGQGQRTLDVPEVDHHVARIAALLDDAGDDVALAAMEVAHDRLVLEVAQSLHDDLACRRGRDPPETGRSVVELGAGLRALRRLRVEDALLTGPHGHVTGLALELHAGDAPGAIGAVIGHEHRLLDGRDDDVQGDVPLALKTAQCGQINIHQLSSSAVARANSTCTWARSMSAYGMRSSVSGSFLVAATNTVESEARQRPGDQ